MDLMGQGQEEAADLGQTNVEDEVGEAAADLADLQLPGRHVLPGALEGGGGVLGLVVCSSFQFLLIGLYFLLCTF